VESDETFTAGFSPAIIKVFRKRMQTIRAAPDERNFYALKSLHFEKLKSNPNQHSMKINDQFRLIIELEGIGQAKTAVIVVIEDYH
jgi:proteic killer suppression protein